MADIFLTGQFLRIHLLLKMIIKYGIDIPMDLFNKNITRLTNQLWKLIPMREHEENWEKQLNTVIIEITGMTELLIYKSEGFQLLTKLEGMLQNKSMPFDLYRKTVFECISLLQGLKNDLQ